MKKNKKMILIALFIAISYIGALIKLPGSMSTIALDSFAGYLGGLILGSVYGAFIAMFAHLVVSMTAGFPLSLVVHIIISLMMFISVFAYSKLSKKYSIFIGSIVGIILNGVIMPLALMIFPFMDRGFLISLIPILTIASVTNIILSNVLYASLKNIIPISQDE